MEKNVIRTIVLNIEAGKATVDFLKQTDIASIGMNLEEFCTKYNNATKSDMGNIVPVIVYIYDDDTFGFSLEDPVTTEPPRTHNKSHHYSEPVSSSNSSNKKEKSSEEAVSVNYEGVLSKVNNVVKSINSTSFVQGNINYNLESSNADFFNSVNTGDSYLHNVSSNLLYQMTVGTTNMETMLNNYSVLDAKLASVAYGLSDGLEQGLFGSPSGTIKSDSVKSFEELANNNIKLFDEKINVGKVGKISINDLKGVMTSKKKALEDEINDSKKLDSSLDELINCSDISGKGWKAFKDILNNYKSCNKVRAKAAQTLQTAYEESEKLIFDYISPDEDIDDSQIPEYEEKIKQLEQEIEDCNERITRLEKQNAALAQTEPSPIYEEGEIVGYDYDNYYSAQAVIKSNNALIADAKELLKNATDAKKEATEYLEKLKGLADIMSQANKIINAAITSIEAMYADEVYKVKTPRLSAIRGEEYVKDTKTTSKKSNIGPMNNAALENYVNKYGLGRTVSMPFVNGNGEKVRISVTLFGPDDEIGVGVNDGKNLKAGTVFKNYNADVVMNCALNGGPIIIDGEVLQNPQNGYLGETNKYNGLEVLCQKQDGTLVSIPFPSGNSKKFINQLKQGYINENGERENYKFVLGGYYNIVDSKGNYVNHKNSYLDYQEHPRSMILQTKKGYTYLITSDGRTKYKSGYTRGTTMKDMYNFAVKNLCDKDDIAIYYNGDGGSSTSYKYVDENGNIVSPNNYVGKAKRKIFVYGVSHV